MDFRRINYERELKVVFNGVQREKNTAQVRQSLTIVFNIFTDCSLNLLQGIIECGNIKSRKMIFFPLSLDYACVQRDWERTLQSQRLRTTHTCRNKALGRTKQWSQSQLTLSFFSRFPVNKSFLLFHSPTLTKHVISIIGHSRYKQIILE